YIAQKQHKNKYDNVTHHNQAAVLLTLRYSSKDHKKLSHHPSPICLIRHHPFPVPRECAIANTKDTLHRQPRTIT
ncbi:unnamed protein product, partial [Ilex paraguariensis]